MATKSHQHRHCRGGPAHGLKEVQPLIRRSALTQRYDVDIRAVQRKPWKKHVRLPGECAVGNSTPFTAPEAQTVNG